MSILYENWSSDFYSKPVFSSPQSETLILASFSDVHTLTMLLILAPYITRFLHSLQFCFICLFFAEWLLRVTTHTLGPQQRHIHFVILVEIPLYWLFFLSIFKYHMKSLFSLWQQSKCTPGVTPWMLPAFSSLGGNSGLRRSLLSTRHPENNQHMLNFQWWWCRSETVSKINPSTL